MRYRNTRHNAGFMVVNVISDRHRLRLRKKGYNGRYSAGRIRGREVLLFEPMTYMNLSGNAVKSVCSSFIENNTDLLVIYDDVDIPLGSMRLRARGSHGGHNGVRSVTGMIGPDFPRLRIGIGKEDMPFDKAGFVLAPFSREERKIMAEVADKAADCVETWLEYGIKEAMNRYNGVSGGC